MKTSLIRIGNSQGIRIPKALLRQCGFDREVEITVSDRSLVVTPAGAPRQGWDEAFKAMGEAGDDAGLLPDDLAQGWDETGWQW